ncbi:MAG TPA: site-specific integrase, partial [Actinomycetota bacterium]|nr:site-specific integrase [Actinomycetota bacterium]
GRRPIALDADLVDRLRAHREAQNHERELVGVGYRDQGLVFANPDGSPVYPEGVSRAFKEQAVAHGLPTIRLHDARHTWATLALQSGVHPKVVQERLGHSSITITLQTYSHVIPSMHEDAAETVASMIRAAKDPKVVPLRDAR